jgi:pimeloyl-ACP methyl ester carboxylesterase
MKAKIEDLLSRIFSREWIALALGAALAAGGVLLAGIGGALMILTGVLLMIGGTVHLMRLAAVWRRYPPMGRLIDIGAGRIHLFAEGEARGNHPVVWLGGGHSAGLAMIHLHRALRTDTRSILIDRFGTGWSDTGPFPRTTEREVDEILAALDKAGETGPSIFAGYSFGGLLAANIARRHPDRVARLLLIDPTPLETIVFGPRLGALREMRRDAFNTALLNLVGFRINLSQRRANANPAHTESGRRFEECLGDALPVLKAVEGKAGARLAEWSIYRELIGSYIADHAWETVVYDGDLGDMPVWLVAPGTAEEVTHTAEVAAAGGDETRRMINFFARSRERYMAASTRSRRVYAPAGSTHQFVYTHPDFIIDVMREAVRPDAG